jgi:hypothetical protein
MWTLFLTAILLVLCARNAVAQSTFGSIVGTVQDQSGAVIGQVPVVVRNLDENSTWTKITNEAGEFQFLNLKPGRYDVSAQKPGFSRVLVSDITLDARQERRVNLKLDVAAVGQVLEVTAEATNINTENATIADTKGGQQVIDLPLNYRGATTSPLGALASVPGVQQDSNGNLSIGGGLPSTIDYSLDGISTSNIRNTGANTNMYPSSELIAEFRVSGVNNNAEFAQVGDITVITKSGTNQLHGSAFEYLQNGAFDATTYGAPDKPRKAYNTFGGSLGGPLVIPRAFNGRNRTFFFADFEGNRLRGSTLQQDLVPTAAERSGDLSAFAQDIADPWTQIQFPNARIPSSRISPVAAQLLQYYPLPNTNAPGLAYNYSTNRPTPSSTSGFDGRVDQTINSKQQLFARWSWKSVGSTGWSSLSSNSQSTLLPPSHIDEHNNNAVVSHSYTITPTLLNEFRFGLSLWQSVEDFPLKGAAIDNALGLTGLDLSQHPNSGGFPVFNFSSGTNFTPIGRQKAGPTDSSTYEYTDNLSWTKGRHTIKLGGDYRRLGYRDVEHFAPADDFGTFTFLASEFTGNALGNLLLGLPNDNEVAVTGPDLDSRSKHYGVYAQDEFRLTPKLTVSYGLRWELHPPFTEQEGNLANFDPATNNVIVPDHTLPVAATFLASINQCGSAAENLALPCSNIVSASQVGLGPGLRKTYYRNFDPRLGIAYRPFGDSRTVLRAGIGIFTASNLGPQSFLLSGISTASLIDYVNYTAPGVPPLFQFPQATTPTSIAANGTADFEIAVDPRLRDAESAQWNVTVERELPGAFTVRGSYIGMNSYRMQNVVDLNQVRPGTAPYNAALTPYANWAQVFQSANNAGANYQSLQVQADRRFTHGLYLQASYTLAKNLTNAEGTGPTGYPGMWGAQTTDRFNQRGDRGNDYGDRRQRFLLSGTYQLPVGHGRSLLSNAHRVTEAFLGGWKLSTVTLLQTGPYQTPTISAAYDQANINAANDVNPTTVTGGPPTVRPDAVGNGNISNPAPGHWYNVNAFQPVPAGAGRDGDAGVGSLQGPGTFTIAGGLSKEFSLNEKASIRFEATFTNLLNHPNFAPPSVDTTPLSVNPMTNKVIAPSPFFGVTSSVQGAENAGNRVGQFAIRLVF